ncbi:LOG family protein, partial [Candidatus Bathyarchaeota archaeon]|nr:LOG family protein [Candidatus Bathyarchaeota archaeon]
MKAETEDGIKKNHFRVVIFGSAQIEPGDPNWHLIYDLAKSIAMIGFSIITGGGPGLMDAASVGHYAGDRTHKTHSIGLQIKLPREQKDANHIDIKKDFSRFSSRLDNFMELANVVIVASGGVGTVLELFYTWQLMQVKMIRNVPIILIGEMWLDLVRWIKKWPLKNR